MVKYKVVYDFNNFDNGTTTTTVEADGFQVVGKDVVFTLLDIDGPIAIAFYANVLSVEKVSE